MYFLLDFDGSLPPEDVNLIKRSMSGSCQHLTTFKQAKGTEPFRIVHAHFVSCVSAESRKRKVLIYAQNLSNLVVIVWTGSNQGSKGVVFLKPVFFVMNRKHWIYYELGMQLLY